MAVSDDAQRFGMLRESLVAAMVATVAATGLMLGVVVFNPPAYRGSADLTLDRPDPAALRALAALAGDPEFRDTFAADKRLARDPAFRPSPLTSLLGRLAGRSEEDDWLHIAPARDGRTLRLFVTATDAGRASTVARQFAETLVARATAQASREEEPQAAAPPPPTVADPPPKAEQIAKPAEPTAAEPTVAQRTAEEPLAPATPPAPEKAQPTVPPVDPVPAPELIAARRAAEEAKAVLAAFRDKLNGDASLEERLSKAKEQLETARAQTIAASAQLKRLRDLATRSPAEIIADTAFDGETFATLRARHGAALAMENALAKALLDRHPMLVDARRTLTLADAAVKDALASVTDVARAESEAAAKREATAQEAVKPLEADKAAREALALEERSLAAKVEEKEAAYQTLLAAKPPSAPPSAPPAPVTPVAPVTQPAQSAPPPVAETAKAPEPAPSPASARQVAEATPNEPPTKEPPQRARLSPAAMPAEPVGMKPIVMVTSAGLLGGALGLLIGGVAASLRSVRRRSDAETG